MHDPKCSFTHSDWWFQIPFHFLTSSSLAFIVYVNKTGSAIKCYQCNSHYDIGCDLNVPTSNYSVDCSTKQERDDKNRPIEYTFCRKIYQVIEFAVNQCKCHFFFHSQPQLVYNSQRIYYFLFYFHILFCHSQCHQIRESFVAVAMIPEAMRVNVTNVMVSAADKWCALVKIVITVITQTHYKVPWCW